MAMPVTQAEWTVEMLDALPDDGQRYEIELPHFFDEAVA